MFIMLHSERSQQLSQGQGAGARLLREGHGGLDQLAVVAAVERHAAHPESAEELRQDLHAHIRGLHALRVHALLHHLRGATPLQVSTALSVR